MKWIWFVIGFVVTVVGVLFITTDWLDTTTTSERVMSRTYSDLTNDIVLYCPGKTLELGMTTWPSTVGSPTVTMHLTDAMLETNAYSGRVYFSRDGNNIGSERSIRHYIGGDSVFFRNANTDPPFPGFSSCCLFTFRGPPDQTTIIKLQVDYIGSMLLYYDFCRMSIALPTDETQTTVQWAPAIYGVENSFTPLVNGQRYMMAWTWLVPSPGSPYQLRNYVLHIDDDFNFTTIIDTGAFDLTYTEDFTFHTTGSPSYYVSSYGLHDIHAYTAVNTTLTLSELQSMGESMLKDSLLPSVEYGPTMTFYKNNAILRTPTVIGTPTTFTGDATPFTIDSTTGVLSGTPTEITQTIQTVDVQVDTKSYNTYTLSYSVLSEPNVIYPASYTGTTGTPHVIVPINVVHVEFNTITPQLPTGMSFVTVDDPENGLTKGMIYGTPTQPIYETVYTVSVTLPTPVGDETIALASSHNLSFSLIFNEPPAELGAEEEQSVTVFEYGTAENNPLLLFAGYEDRIFNGNRYREFTPSENLSFHQYQATLPPQLMIHPDTGAINGIAETSTNGIQTVTVRATHRSTGVQYSRELHLQIIQNMNVLVYDSEYLIPEESDLVIQPSQVDGTAIDMELGTTWPEGTTVDLSGTITIPQSQVPHYNTDGLTVRATTINSTLERSTSLRSETNHTLKYVVGGITTALGIGTMGVAAWDSFSSVKQIEDKARENN
jgi:hypothetical protein